MQKWSYETYEKIDRVYKGIVEDYYMNRSPDIVALEMHVSREMLKRDFTKRQLKIITFIYTFSFPYNKEAALIKNMQDFELCGVSKTKISEELDKLAELRVIEWDKGTKEFSINDPHYWEVPFNRGVSDTRYQQMFIENLDHAGVDISTVISRLR
ncbi:replication protein [Bacillus tequilensis]|uniref:replication protein n=1 Tax=Bacillus tequilensis TaxID=227866 RepID=UPI0004642CB9|nr:replication protein [Bacillus tequilensis]MDR4436218.1 replication protein [Bacillus tequilensis]SPU01142.1 phage replication protein O, N-terminal domain [Bacillus tequilensis]